MDNTDIERKARECFEKIKEKSEDDFEKQLTFIASGALGITFTFLEKLVNIDKSIYLWQLASGWGLLAIALCANLASHYLSKNLAEQSSEDYNAYCEERITYDALVKKIKNYNRKINFVNFSSIGTLFIGICFIISFVTINIYHVSKNNTPNRSTEEKGRTIPIPQPIQQRPLPQPQTGRDKPNIIPQK